MTAFPKRIWGIVLAAALFCAACARPVPEDPQVYRFQLGSTYKNPASSALYNSLGESIDEFCHKVEEETDGRVIITPFYDSTLGGAAELFEQLRMGELDFAVVQPFSNVDKRFGALSLPFLFQDQDEVYQLVCRPDGPIHLMLEDWMGDYGVTILAVGGADVFRGFVNSKKPVYLPSDLHDLTVRIYNDGVGQTYWSKLAIPIQLPFSEVYTAMQTNIVDGLEFAPTGVVAYKLTEVAGYYTDINWQWTFGTPIMANEEAFSQLPEDLQQIVRRCALEVMEEQYRVSRDQNQQAMEKMEELGVQVVRLTEEQRNVWEENARQTAPVLRRQIGEETYDQVTQTVMEWRSRSGSAETNE